MKKLILLLLATASLSAAPQAIVFDFGGVMTTKPDRKAVIEFLCTSFQLTPAEFEQLNAEKHQAMKSGITDEEFWLNLAEKRDIQLGDDWTQRLKSLMKEAVGVNPEMYVLVEELRTKQMPVALLSNIDERLAKLLRGFDFYEPFEPCLLSCEIGVQKPNPQAYKILLDRLKVPATDVVFVDDREENVEAAKNLGIDAILFESAEQIRQELNTRGVL